MKTENSFQYFRGKEARGLGKPRDACTRLRGHNRRSWQKGWDDENALRGLAARPPEVAVENEEAREWLESELEAWRREMGD